MFRSATLGAAYLLDAVHVRHRRWVGAGRAFAARLHGARSLPIAFDPFARFLEIRLPQTSIGHKNNWFTDVGRVNLAI